MKFFILFRTFSVLLFSLLMTNFGFGQSKEIDSLRKILNHSNLHDTVRIKTNFALARRFGEFSLDSLKKYTFNAEKLSQRNNDYMLDAVYYYLAMYYEDIGELDKSKDYNRKVLNLIDSVESPKKYANTLSNYAILFNETSEIDTVISYKLRALKISESIDDKFGMGKSQFNLAVTYSNIGFDSLSVKYLKQALINGEASGEKVFAGFVLNSLIMYSLKNKNFDLAEKYLQKSEAICEETGSKRVCYNTYLRKGTYFNKLKQFDKAEQAFSKSLEYAKQSGVDSNMELVYANMGKHYVLSRKPKKAIASFKKFEELKKNSRGGKLSELAYDNWSKAERMVGNYDRSDELWSQYLGIRDSLDADKNKVLLTNAETKYQTEKKDKEIAKQQLSIQESKSNTRTMSILMVSLLLGAILLWFSFWQRQKRMQQQLVAIEREQEVRTLESLMEGEEKERFRIAKELHDGVNGDLAAIKFKLTSILETNNQVINEAVAMIDTSSEQVRAISHNLVPPSLRDFNILEAVATYCENMNTIHDPEISFQHLGNDIVLDKKQEANLFRIVQELVANSIKHAEAKEIHVQLSNVEDHLQLTVEDDGKGFDVNIIVSDGIGMQNVKSRVDYLGGLMDIKSDAKGTSFTITITDKAEKS